MTHEVSDALEEKDETKQKHFVAAWRLTPTSLDAKIKMLGYNGTFSGFFLCTL